MHSARVRLLSLGGRRSGELNSEGISSPSFSRIPPEFYCPAHSSKESLEEEEEDEEFEEPKED